MKWRIGLLFLLMTNQVWCADWTWSYRKYFSGSELNTLSHKAHVTFAKLATPPFKQLIFAWNAFRPKQGYFTFYVQSRNARTKVWSSWYKMVEWGAAVQRSHFLKVPGEPEYVYVRLEQASGEMADGFRLKVEAHGSANLANLRALSVSISDLSKFQIEPVGQYLKLPSVLVRDVPRHSQMVLPHPQNKQMCSPTSTSMLVSFLQNKPVDPLQFASKVYDRGLGAYGSWPFNTAHAFECMPKYCFRVTRLDSFGELYAYLKRQMPVVVSVRGWISGAPQEYRQGHLLMVIGWDQERQMVICHDPAIKGHRRVRRGYRLGQFLRGWEASHRLAYVADKF